MSFRHPHIVVFMSDEKKTLMTTQKSTFPPSPQKKFFNYLLIRQEYAFIHDYFLMMMMFVENRKKKFVKLIFLNFDFTKKVLLYYPHNTTLPSQNFCRLLRKKNSTRKDDGIFHKNQVLFHRHK